MKRSKIDYLTCLDGTIYVNKQQLINVIKDMKRITKKQLLKELDKCREID